MTKINFKSNKTKSIIAAILVIGLLTVGPNIYSAYAATYQSEFGSSGSGNGQFDLPIGITIDGSTNSYVVDMNNNRVEKFDSTGTYQSQFGSSGSGNGQFDFPRGITFDGTNLWITDTGNDRVEEFSISGSYQSQFGSSGTGNG